MARNIRSRSDSLSCLRLSLGGRQGPDIQVHAGRPGQIGEHVHERALLDLDEEGYGITLFVAAETVEELAGLVDV